MEAPFCQQGLSEEACAFRLLMAHGSRCGDGPGGARGASGGLSRKPFPASTSTTHAPALRSEAVRQLTRMPEVDTWPADSAALAVETLLAHGAALVTARGDPDNTLDWAQRRFAQATITGRDLAGSARLLGLVAAHGRAPGPTPLDAAPPLERHPLGLGGLGARRWPQAQGQASSWGASPAADVLAVMHHVLLYARERQRGALCFHPHCATAALAAAAGAGMREVVHWMLAVGAAVDGVDLRPLRRRQRQPQQRPMPAASEERPAPACAGAAEEAVAVPHERTTPGVVPLGGAVEEQPVEGGAVPGGALAAEEEEEQHLPPLAVFEEECACLGAAAGAAAAAGQACTCGRELLAHGIALAEDEEPDEEEDDEEEASHHLHEGLAMLQLDHPLHSHPVVFAADDGDGGGGSPPPEAAAVRWHWQVAARPLAPGALRLGGGKAGEGGGGDGTEGGGGGTPRSVLQVEAVVLTAACEEEAREEEEAVAVAAAGLRGDLEGGGVVAAEVQQDVGEGGGGGGAPVLAGGAAAEACVDFLPDVLSASQAPHAQQQQEATLEEGEAALEEEETEAEQQPQDDDDEEERWVLCPLAEAAAAGDRYVVELLLEVSQGRGSLLVRAPRHAQPGLP